MGWGSNNYMSGATSQKKHVYIYIPFYLCMIHILCILNVYLDLDLSQLLTLPPVLTSDLLWVEAGKLEPVCQIQPVACFCVTQELRIRFTFFKGCKTHRQEYATEAWPDAVQKASNNLLPGPLHKSLPTSSLEDLLASCVWHDLWLLSHFILTTILEGG